MRFLAYFEEYLPTYRPQDFQRFPTFRPKMSQIPWFSLILVKFYPNLHNLARPTGLGFSFFVLIIYVCPSKSLSALFFPQIFFSKSLFALFFPLDFIFLWTQFFRTFKIKDFSGSKLLIFFENRAFGPIFLRNFFSKGILIPFSKFLRSFKTLTFLIF